MKQIQIGVMACLLVGVTAAHPLAQVAAQAPAQTPAQAPAAPTGQILQRILVKVNGEIFTQTDLEELQINELQKRNRDVSKPEELQSNAALRALLVEITPKILETAIDELMLLQRARELGYKMTDAQFKEAVEGIKKDNKIDDATLLKALEQQGMTMDQLRKNLERTALIEQLKSQEIMSHVSLTEEESRQYYSKHQSEFVAPPTITLREILVSATATPSTFGGGSGLSFGGSTDSAAQAKVQSVIERLQKGEDFAAVATEVSDAQSKARGGLMTPVTVDDLSDAIRTATEKLKPGEITSPIKTTRGYQIFKVESRTPQATLPFEQVRKDIAQKIFEQRIGGEVKKYLDRLRGQALIEWKDEDLKKMYEARVNAK
jgi:parvulin-like peptidyl-prolyl isomerase